MGFKLPRLKLLKYTTDRLARTSATVRERLDQVDKLDRVSGDLLLDVAADLEKHCWMIQVQEVD